MFGVKLNNLLIDLQNPRYYPRTSQREALMTIVHDQGVKLVHLAEDVVDRGLNPSDLLMATLQISPICSLSSRGTDEWLP